jgi:hypothetical protein
MALSSTERLAALALIEAAAPRNEIEGALAVQMACTHAALCRSWRDFGAAAAPSAGWWRLHRPRLDCCGPIRCRWRKDQPKDGRTSGYDAEIAQAICERLVDGESLRAICADPAMPARATVFRWLARNQEFRRSYALARQCHAEDFAFETLAIAADSSRDYVKTTGIDGKVTRVFDRENFARQRLRIKARKMILARMAPRKYGNP